MRRAVVDVVVLVTGSTSSSSSSSRGMSITVSEAYSSVRRDHARTPFQTVCFVVIEVLFCG